MEEGRPQVSEQLTIDTGAALFESCDIFIETDRDGRLFIVADRKARALVSTLIDTAINWGFGTPLQRWLTTAPPDRRAVDLKFRDMDRDGHLRRLPKIGNAEKIGMHPYSLRLGAAARSADLRVVVYDEKKRRKSSVNRASRGEFGP